MATNNTNCLTSGTCSKLIANDTSRKIYEEYVDYYKTNKLEILGQALYKCRMQTKNKSGRKMSQKEFAEKLGIARSTLTELELKEGQSPINRRLQKDTEKIILEYLNNYYFYSDIILNVDDSIDLSSNEPYTLEHLQTTFSPIQKHKEMRIASALNTCLFYKNKNNILSHTVKYFAIEKYNIHGYELLRLFPSNELNYVVYINKEYPFRIYLKLTIGEGTLFAYNEDFDVIPYEILDCLEKMSNMKSEDSSHIIEVYKNIQSKPNVYQYDYFIKQFDENFDSLFLSSTNFILDHYTKI